MMVEPGVYRFKLGDECTCERRSENDVVVMMTSRNCPIHGSYQDITMTKKEALIDKILTRIITECPMPPSGYFIETTRAILREELPAPVLR
jgi:hypothetical protein